MEACLGPYRLGAACGLGGDAVVYEAWRDGMNLSFAVKLPRRDREPAPAIEATLRREASLLHRLRHPHIVPLLDADTDHPYLVMPLLPAGSLQNVVGRSAPWPAPTVAHALSGAAAALDWLHERLIVHGDVKPGNLLIAADGLVHLTDFGAATSTDAVPSERTATPAYAAPERLLGQPANPRDDVHGLAAVAYALLTGHPPFGADPALALDEPARPPSLNDVSWHIMRSVLTGTRSQARPRATTMIAAIDNRRTGARAYAQAD